MNGAGLYLLAKKLVGFHALAWSDAQTTLAHTLRDVLRSANTCMSRQCGQDHLHATQATRDTGCQVFIVLLGFFMALQTSFWTSPSYPSGVVTWYGMGLCRRNLLTSGSVNLGPSCFLVLFFLFFLPPYLFVSVWGFFSLSECTFENHA